MRLYRLWGQSLVQRPTWPVNVVLLENARRERIHPQFGFAIRRQSDVIQMVAVEISRLAVGAVMDEVLYAIDGQRGRLTARRTIAIIPSPLRPLRLVAQDLGFSVRLQGFESPRGY